MSTTTPGSLYIFSAPSGAGKTSLVNELVKQTEQLVVSVSHTTRAMRPGEQDGVHYHFVEVPAFEQMVADNLFVEHAKVFDNYYGTSQLAIEQQLAQGLDVILEIDWQGARQVRERIAGAISVFILPPSRPALEDRLRGRGQDSDVIIARRMHDAISEMSHYDEYDFVVVNDNFKQATDELQAIVTTQRLAQKRQKVALAALIRQLLA
jgi:guanylate kinase